VSESAVLEAALNLIDATSPLDTQALIAAIDTVLAIQAPAGDPDVIAAQADTYRHVAYTCGEVVDDELTVKAKSLPASWRGQAADSATWALDCLGWQAYGACEAFTAGAKALATWADHLRTAQHQDAHGREALERARTELWHAAYEQILDPLITFQQIKEAAAMKEAAAAGCHDRWSAARLAAGAADHASAALGQWSEQARAQQIRVPGVNALTAVTLAYYGDNPGLSPTAMMLASKHLDAMSPADRAAFEKLVDHASSTTEAEYLWKAASAGYNLRQIESFDAIIHPHGNNYGWLQQHLDPGIITSPPVPGGRPWPTPPRTWISAAFAQAYDPDYKGVDASAVMARLAADPVLMLGVTTGKGPAAIGGVEAGDDSNGAVTVRAQILFNQNYVCGLAAEHYPAGDPPLGARGQIAVDDRLLTPVTGSPYHYQPLNDTADRQEALPKIEAAVQAGKPVPIDVQSSPAEQNAMIIEDYQNGELEIYNSWGYTQWVPTHQFVDGQLGAVTDQHETPRGGLPDPYGAALPQQ
jgi:hypothetical protein